MKPVAWMSQGGDVSRSKDYFEEMGFKDLIPLYTAPRELSDEVEMLKGLLEELGWHEVNKDGYVKKASEK